MFYGLQTMFYGPYNILHYCLSQAWCFGVRHVKTLMLLETIKSMQTVEHCRRSAEHVKFVIQFEDHSKFQCDWLSNYRFLRVPIHKCVHESDRCIEVHAISMFVCAVSMIC